MPDGLSMQDIQAGELVSLTVGSGGLFEVNAIRRPGYDIKWIGDVKVGDTVGWREFGGVLGRVTKLDISAPLGFQLALDDGREFNITNTYQIKVYHTQEEVMNEVKTRKVAARELGVGMKIRAVGSEGEFATLSSKVHSAFQVGFVLKALVNSPLGNTYESEAYTTSGAMWEVFVEDEVKTEATPEEPKVDPRIREVKAVDLRLNDQLIGIDGDSKPVTDLSYDRHTKQVTVKTLSSYTYQENVNTYQLKQGVKVKIYVADE